MLAEPTTAPAVHPAAALFPMLDDAALATLATDIAEHGLVHPIVLHEGAVLDGRNRLRACEMAGMEPRYVEWEPNGLTPTAWVIATNLHRRHLDLGQRAAIAAEALPMLEAETKERQRQAGREHGRGMDSFSPIGEKLSPPLHAHREAAEQFQVSPKSVERAKYLLSNHREAFEAVKEGKKTLNRACVETGYEGRASQRAGRDHPTRQATAEPVAAGKTRGAVAVRRERIAAMAREGYREDAIAEAVGMQEMSVRQVMHDMGIPTMAEKLRTRTPRIDANRVMEGIVENAQPSETALAAIDWAALDPERRGEWKARLTRAIKDLSALRNRL